VRIKLLNVHSHLSALGIEISSGTWMNALSDKLSLILPGFSQWTYLFDEDALDICIEDNSVVPEGISVLGEAVPYDSTFG
jgi:hypothetical protein